MSFGKKISKQKRLIKKNILHVVFGNIIFGGFILLLIWIGFVSFQTINQAVWDGKHQLNFVIQSEQIIVFSYHPEDQFLNILAIPKSTHIEVAKNFGAYQIGNIYNLGNMEKIDGGELLLMSLRNFFGVPIDGYIKIDNCNIGSRMLIEANLLPILGCLTKGKIVSNFNFWDFVRFIPKLHSLALSQIKTINFLQTGMLQEEVLPDNSLILLPDYPRIDNLVLELFGDKTALNEAVTIKVSNGTEVSGLAKEVGRLIKNFGAELVGTDDAGTLYNESVLYYRDAKIKNSYTFRKIKQIFKVKKLIHHDQIETDINLIVGNNY